MLAYKYCFPYVVCSLYSSYPKNDLTFLVLSSLCRKGVNGRGWLAELLGYLGAQWGQGAVSSWLSGDGGHILSTQCLHVMVCRVRTRAAEFQCISAFSRKPLPPPPSGWPGSSPKGPSLGTGQRSYVRQMRSVLVQPDLPRTKALLGQGRVEDWNF